MTNIQPHNEVSTPLSAKDDAAKTNALIAYCLMAVGFFTSIFWLVGAVWAMVKKGDAADTIYEDHLQTSSKYFGGALALALLAFS